MRVGLTKESRRAEISNNVIAEFREFFGLSFRENLHTCASYSQNFGDFWRNSAKLTIFAPVKIVIVDSN